VGSFHDVRPTDWAYQALANLVDRYGCGAGYPNGSFRGGNSISRYEAAALLLACLERVQESTDELRRLSKEFQAELAKLRGRVDGLEARVGRLPTDWAVTLGGAIARRMAADLAVFACARLAASALCDASRPTGGSTLAACGPGTACAGCAVPRSGHAGCCTTRTLETMAGPVGRAFTHESCAWTCAMARHASTTRHSFAARHSGRVGKSAPDTPALGA
jgi:hypothetical protein